MARFKYVAMDAKGAERQGVIEVENKSQAIALIREKGLFPTSVTEMVTRRSAVLAAVQPGQTARRTIRLPPFLEKLFVRRVKNKQLMVFTRQLATLIQAGLPLLRGLKILHKQEKHPSLRDAVSGMGDAVEGGTTFSEALAQYPKIFDKLFVNMVKAGEAAGALDLVLIRLATFMEKAERIKNKIKGAMIYPIVVMVLALGILSVMLITVIPKFEEIFADLLEGAKLPALTRFVIGASKLLTQRGVLVVFAVGGFVMLMKLVVRTKKGRYFMDKLKIKAPIFGPLTHKTAIGRFARTLGTLVASGVPILQALNIARDTSGNSVLAEAIMQIHDSVKEGDAMTLPMEASRFFPGMVVSMVDVGEETGALPEMLIKIAENYDDEVDTAVEGLTSVIEPVLIVFLALVIGVVVIAMFMPLISLIEKMSQ